MIFEWEIVEGFIHTDESAITHRAKVIGGWIVKNYTMTKYTGRIAESQSMVFVPDPDHYWSIEN